MSKARDIASAIPAPSTVSSAELGYLDGVTSAVQTQLDAKTAKSTLSTTGDIYYASAANTPARLGIGSSAQVLTVAAGVPSWATPAGGGGMTLLDTLTLSGSSVTSNTLTGTYKRLFIHVYKAVNSEAAELRMRLNEDTGSNYSVQGSSAEGSTNYASGTTSASQANNLALLGTTTDQKIITQGIITIDNPSQTDTVFWNSEAIGYDGTLMRQLKYSGNYNSSAAITKVTFFPASGTFSSGSILIYGVN